MFRDAAARRRLVGTAGEILAALALATAVSALLRAWVDLADPSPVYLLAVAAVAIRGAARWPRSSWRSRHS